MKRLVGTLVLVTLLLSGCGGIRSGGGGKTVSLPLQTGMRLVAVPVIAGMPVGGNIEISTPGVKTISVDGRENGKLQLAWTGTRRERVETPGSEKPQYQEIQISGRLAVADPSASEHAASVLVPGLWPAGREISADDGSGIWLSRKALMELKETGKTRWNAGMFEGVLANFLEAAELLRAFRKMADGLRPEKQEALRYLTADTKPVEFRLKVDDRTVKVLAMRARNWFIDLYILDDPDNPLVLKAAFNPVSDGVLDLFSPLGILKAILGYQVTEVQLP